MDPVITIILSVVAVCVTITIAVCGGTWVIARAMAASDRRTNQYHQEQQAGLSTVREGISALGTRLDDQAAQNSRRADESLTRHQTVLHRIGDVEGRVQSLHERVDAIESADHPPEGTR